MLTYTGYSPTPSIQYTCPICLDKDSSTNPDTIIHTEDGYKHPLHKTCMRAWLQVHDTCPTCRTQIDKRPFLSWQERTIYEIKCVARDILNGAKVACNGAIGATIGGIAGSALWGALGGVALTGAPIPIGRSEASAAGFGFFVSTGGYNTQLQSMISRTVMASMMGHFIESAAMGGIPIGRVPIVACAVMGAVFGAACGLFERH